ncbi:MAG: glycosyl hydrolase family 28-related protein [Pseudomonadota bacterium]
MSRRLIEPGRTFFGNDNQVLSGGLLHFFETGTSTRKDTYSNPELTVPNANPVVLTANGRLPGPIWGDGEYKFQLTTASDPSITSPLITEDPLIGVAAASTRQAADLAALLALAKSSLNNNEIAVVGGPRGGTFIWSSASTATPNGGTIFAADEGGTGRWLRQFHGPHNVLWYGAVGDDSTLNTAAIQAALDATAGTDALYFPKGRYRCGPLTVQTVLNLVMLGDGMSNNGNNAATLVYEGPSNGEQLFLDGVTHSTIHGVSFMRGTAPPRAYIRTDSNGGFAITSIDLHKVLFRGENKTDASIAFDCGPNSPFNNADFNWGRVEFRNLQEGLRLNQDQQLAYNFEYIRAVGVGTSVNVVKGGCINIGSYNATDCDLHFKVRGGGANTSQIVINNARPEETNANANSVFLDAASDAAGGVRIVLNGATVTNNMTGTHTKIGKATTVIMHGCSMPAGSISLEGTQADGDALLIAEGSRIPTPTTNDFGFYKITGIDDNALGGSPLGGNAGRPGKSLVFDQIKMPTWQKQYFTMPINRPSGGTTTRALPPDARVTAVDVTIKDAGSATAGDTMQLNVGGVAIGSISMGTTGARRFEWQANALLFQDTSTITLGNPLVLTGLDSTPELSWSVSGGSVVNSRTAAAECIVEYVQTGVSLTGLDS